MSVLRASRGQIVEVACNRLELNSEFNLINARERRGQVRDAPQSVRTIGVYLQFWWGEAWAISPKRCLLSLPSFRDMSSSNARTNPTWSNVNWKRTCIVGIFAQQVPHTRPVDEKILLTKKITCYTWQRRISMIVSQLLLSFKCQQQTHRQAIPTIETSEGRWEGDATGQASHNNAWPYSHESTPATTRLSLPPRRRAAFIKNTEYWRRRRRVPGNLYDRLPILYVSRSQEQHQRRPTGRTQGTLAVSRR